MCTFSDRRGVHRNASEGAIWEQLSAMEGREPVDKCPTSLALKWKDSWRTPCWRSPTWRSPVGWRNPDVHGQILLLTTYLSACLPCPVSLPTAPPVIPEVTAQTNSQPSTPVSGPAHGESPTRHLTTVFFPINASMTVSGSCAFAQSLAWGSKSCSERSSLMNTCAHFCPVLTQEWNCPATEHAYVQL